MKLKRFLAVACLAAFATATMGQVPKKVTDAPPTAPTADKKVADGDGAKKKDEDKDGDKDDAKKDGKKEHRKHHDHKKKEG